MSEIEISELVEVTLDELARRENVPKPEWKKGRFMKHMRGVIVFDMPTIKKFWDIDKEKARVYTRHILAHEFHHYLEWVKGLTIPYAYSESASETYACIFVGLSAKDLALVRNYLWDVLEEIEAAKARPKAMLVKVAGLGILGSWLDKVSVGSVLKFREIVEGTGLPKGSCWAMLERMADTGRLKRKGRDYIKVW